MHDHHKNFIKYEIAIFNVTWNRQLHTKKCHSQINANVWCYSSRGIELLDSLRKSIFVIRSNVSCAEKETEP